MKNKIIIILILSIVLISGGVFLDGHRFVKNVGSIVCLECIGFGK